MSLTTHMACASQTDPGRRAENDDCMLISPEHGLYVVCDGASARIGGRTAAELACQALREAAPGMVRRLGDRLGPDAAELADEALQQAHERILAAQAEDPALSGMTTTIAMVIHRGNELLVSHVGDSRVYLYRAPELRQLTRDHSLENYLKDNPEVNPRIKRPGKTLVRALGLKSATLGAQHSRVALAQGDLVLLCSDGLTDSLPSWTLREVLGGVRYTSVGSVASALVRTALTHGSMDNVSVLLLQAADRPEVTGRTVMYDVEAGSGAAAGPVVLGWLTFLEGHHLGDVIPVQASTVIGADPGCRVVIEEDYVSGRHAEVLRSEHGFLLRDLDSTNGTYVNDVRTKEVPLVDGDVIRIGMTPIVFKSHQLER